MDPVYFLKTDLQNLQRNPKNFVAFLKHTPFFASVKKNDFVGIKMHFGETNNNGYIRPMLLKGFIETLKRIGAKPFLFDSNTLYRGKRANAIDHFNLAFYTHQFKLLGVPIIIADGLKGRDYIEVDSGGIHCPKAKIVPILEELDVLFGLSHLTGHILTGFGASLKNIAMGCASRAGKMQQHCDVAPRVHQKICVLCGDCVKICPVSAIVIEKDSVCINDDVCIGCAQCISICPKQAMKIQWSENHPFLQEKMVEYAQAVLKTCPRHFFVTFALFITKECDCMSRETQGVIPDTGIFASFCPVALDKATLDTVVHNVSEDVFRTAHPEVDYNHQFIHAQRIGLGSGEYKVQRIEL